MTQHRCAAPITLGSLVAYFADDLEPAAADEVEAALFFCAACAAEATRVGAVVSALKTAIPVVLSTLELDALALRGLVIARNPCRPGARQPAVFPQRVDVLVHELGELDLTQATRVEVAVRVESSGATMGEDPDAPFARDRGAVYIACQRHFAHLPPDVVFDVRVHGPTGITAARYFVPHVFESLVRPT